MFNRLFLFQDKGNLMICVKKCDVFKAHGMCKTHATYYHPTNKCNDSCKQYETNKHSLSLDILKIFLRMKL